MITFLFVKQTVDIMQPHFQNEITFWKMKLYFQKCNFIFEKLVRFLLASNGEFLLVILLRKTRAFVRRFFSHFEHSIVQEKIGIC